VTVVDTEVISTETRLRDTTNLAFTVLFKQHTVVLVKVDTIHSLDFSFIFIRIRTVTALLANTSLARSPKTILRSCSLMEVSQLFSLLTS
jgi:hypothetical protein